MYGLIGKVSLVPGQRDAFAALLLESRSGDAGLSQLRHRH